MALYRHSLLESIHALAIVAIYSLPLLLHPHTRYATNFYDWAFPTPVIWAENGGGILRNRSLQYVNLSASTVPRSVGAVHDSGFN